MTDLLALWPIRLAVFLVAFSIFFAPKFGIGRAALLSIPVSIALVYAVGFYRQAGTARRHFDLVDRAREAAVPRDGEAVAVCGTIEPLGETLRSPVYDEPSVLYHYKFDGDVHSRAGSGRASVRYHVDYAGYASVPAIVRGARLTAALANFPTLHGFGEIGQGTRPLDSFKRHLAAATFDVPAGKTLEWVGFADMDWNGRGTFSKNFRRAETVDPAKSQNFLEQRVHPGSSVCAIGLWSAPREALLRGAAQDLLLYEGTAEQVRDRFETEIKRGNRRAFITGAVTILAALALMLLVPRKKRIRPAP